MQKKIPVLDTNIIIRFLTADNKAQAEKIEILLKQSLPHSLEIPDVVIMEIVYVLLSYYGLSKKDVIGKITQLVDFDRFKVHKKLIKKSLEIFQIHNISFVDAYLCALVSTNKNESLYSFDKRLLRIKNTKIINP